MKTLALSKILHLVGDVIVFGILRGDDPVVVFQRLPRPVAKCRATMLDGVAVALRADLDQALARKQTGLNDPRGFFCPRIRLMIVHMLPPRSVTFLARDAKEELLAMVLVTRAGHMLQVGIVALETARRCFP